MSRDLSRVRRRDLLLGKYWTRAKAVERYMQETGETLGQAVGALGEAAKDLR